MHKDIFRLAVCASKLEIHEQLWERIFKLFQNRIPAAKNVTGSGMNRHTRFDSDGDEVIVVDSDDDAETQVRELPSQS